MSKRTDKYLHMVRNNRPGKWMTIGLRNLLVEMTPDELVWLLPQAQATVIQRYQGEVARLTALEAPPVIMDVYNKQLEAAKSGNHEHVVLVRRRINRLQTNT
jgi:hypothetical protein